MFYYFGRQVLSIVRELPPFRGPTPGPTDPKLNETSLKPTDVMHHQIPLEFKSRWCTYTKMHARAWRGKRPDWKNDDVEKSMGKMHTALRPHHFDLWVAARVRVAQLKPEVSAHLLWSTNSSLFDTQLLLLL